MNKKGILSQKELLRQAGDDLMLHLREALAAATELRKIKELELAEAREAEDDLEAALNGAFRISYGEEEEEE